MTGFYVPTKIYTGESAFENLKRYPIRTICIICDPFVETSGMLKKVLQVMEDMGATTHIFSDITPDPSTDLVSRGVSWILEKKPDTVMAMGGGSAIDAAKAISFMYQQVAKVGHPLCIVAPTTSGTGSEVTNFAVITDSATHTKYPLVDDKLLPRIAILDPTLVRSVPPRVTADTGMDVLTHAIEANVSTAASDFSDALAEKAIRLVRDYLPRAYRQGEDTEAREHMHNASCLAGVAFNHASLGINHSIAHVLGGRFGIPHGRANALVLPYVIEFNSHMYEKHFQTDNRAAKIYAHIGIIINPGTYVGPQAVRNLTIAINKMNKEFEIPATLREYGIDEKAFLEQVSEMAEIAVADKCTATNPRTITKPQMVELMKRIYYGR
ncbi:MAG: iron-containing alcohol dehydrogenase [Clostridia bacterium]|nr:iron-containing alcohol dehydrogenase [Clostridia bacterium]